MKILKTTKENLFMTLILLLLLDVITGSTFMHFPSYLLYISMYHFLNNENILTLLFYNMFLCVGNIFHN